MDMCAKCVLGSEFVPAALPREDSMIRDLDLSLKKAENARFMKG